LRSLKAFQKKLKLVKCTDHTLEERAAYSSKGRPKKDAVAQFDIPSEKRLCAIKMLSKVGLHIVFVNGVKHQVTNLKERHYTILRCLGPPYQKLYYSELW